jgi:hypothetical protein
VLRGFSLSVACLAVLLLASVAVAEPATHDLSSVFHVAKSENRNQVHYGVRLDASCAPAGNAPMTAYWRMLERGPLATEPLLDREVGAYGFAEQTVVERADAGGRVRVRLRALPSRPITVETGRRDDGCVAAATTTIGGRPATLESVFVKLRWPFGVDHLVLVGRSVADGRTLQERVSP